MPRLRFILAAVVLTLTGGLLVAARADAQVPPDLKAAVLTPGDLEPNWRVLFESPVTADSYTLVFGRRTREVLGILVVNDPLRETSPAAVLYWGETVLDDGPRGAGRVQMVTPAVIGEEAVQATVSLPMATGESLSGAVLAWRQGAFVVAMYHLTDLTADVAPLAQQQSAKLATVLGAPQTAVASGLTTSVGPAVRPNRATCAAILVALATVTSVRGERVGTITVGSSTGTICTAGS